MIRIILKIYRKQLDKIKSMGIPLILHHFSVVLYEIVNNLLPVYNDLTG